MENEKPIVKMIPVEPKVYSVLIKTTIGISLYSGVHVSLEDAIEAARVKLLDAAGLSHNEPINLSVKLWSIMDAQSVLSKFADVEIEQEQKKEEVNITQEFVDPEFIKTKNKNELMKMLIASKNIELVKQARKVLNKKEITFVIEEIKKIKK